MNNSVIWINIEVKLNENLDRNYQQLVNRLQESEYSWNLHIEITVVIETSLCLLTLSTKSQILKCMENFCDSHFYGSLMMKS